MVPISIDQLMYRFFIKYDNLTTLTRQAFAGSDATSVNIYINLSEVVRTIYKNNVTITEPNILASSILNMCAHYKNYYINYCNTKPKIFLVFSNDTQLHNQFLDSYDLSFKKLKSVNKRITDFILENLNILKLLCPYIPDVYFLTISGFEAGIAIADMISKNDGSPNIIISRAIFDYQIIPYANSLSRITAMFKNKKSGPICITNDNLYQSYIMDKRYTDTTEKLSKDLSPALFSLLIALSSEPSRNIKSILNIRNSFGIINQAINSYIIENRYNSVVQTIFNNLASLKPGINPIEISNRYRAFDLIYQLGLYSESYYVLSNDWYIDLYDPQGVQEINNTYFKNNPIDLNRL